MPRSRRPRKPAAKKPSQERSREMVEVILTAATRVFATHGYAKTTTNRVAEVAGVSVGSVYQYFPDKNAMLTELMRRYRENLVTRIGQSVSEMNEITFEGVVRTLLTAIFHDDQIDPTLHRVLIERVLRTDQRREIEGFEERLEGLFADALRGAKDLISVREYDICAFILVRVVLSVAHGALVDRPRYNTPSLIDELTRLIVGYVGVKEIRPA